MDATATGAAAPVYLDHNATTPLCEDAAAAMAPWLGGCFGNASSPHAFGRAARRALDEARQQVAAAVGAEPGEVIFTASASEANNLFVKGAAEQSPPGLIAVAATEHPAVLRPARSLARHGWRLREIAVDVAGEVDGDDYAAALKLRPGLVSVMLANNETGVIQDIAALAAAAAANRALFHSDAAQALGKLRLDFRSLNAAGVSALSLSAHKAGGPCGAGALIIDKRLDLAPLIDGGGHERGLRAGTENVAACVGFGVACEQAAARLAANNERLAALRDSMQLDLAGLGAHIFAVDAPRLPNTLCFSFTGVEGAALVSALDRAGFAVASGSACASSSGRASPVLLAMGAAPELARGAVRVSLGPQNTAAQASAFVATCAAVMNQLQSMAVMLTAN